MLAETREVSPCANADPAHLAHVRGRYRAVAEHRRQLAAARNWPELVFARRALALAECDLGAALDALLGEEAARG